MFDILGRIAGRLMRELWPLIIAGLLAEGILLLALWVR